MVKLFFALLAIWLFLFLFKITLGGLIHVLLVVALVGLILQLLSKD